MVHRGLGVSRWRSSLCRCRQLLGRWCRPGFGCWRMSKMRLRWGAGVGHGLGVE
jgi:hypothetical protein